MRISRPSSLVLADQDDQPTGQQQQQRCRLARAYRGDSRAEEIASGRLCNVQRFPTALTKETWQSRLQRVQVRCAMPVDTPDKLSPRQA